MLHTYRSASHASLLPGYLRGHHPNEKRPLCWHGQSIKPMNGLLEERPSTHPFLNNPHEATPKANMHMQYHRVHTCNTYRISTHILHISIKVTKCHHLSLTAMLCMRACTLHAVARTGAGQVATAPPGSKQEGKCSSPVQFPGYTFYVQFMPYTVGIH